MVNDHPHEADNHKALVVRVYRRWPWQTDVFYNEGDIGVQITGEVLQVVMPDRIVSYNPRYWRRVTSRKIPSRVRV